MEVWDNQTYEGEKKNQNLFVCSESGGTVITPCNVYMYFSLKSGVTALQIASSGGHVEYVKLLLDKGANIDLQDKVSAVSQSIIVYLVCSLV